MLSVITHSLTLALKTEAKAKQVIITIFEVKRNMFGV